MIRSNCATNEILGNWLVVSRLDANSCVASTWLIVVLYHVALSGVIAHGFSVEVKQLRARLVPGWVTDRGLSHMHGFPVKITRWVTLTYEWPDDFCKGGDMHLDPTLQGHRRLNILCFWTGHNVGRPDVRDAAWRRTGTASSYNIGYNIGNRL